MKLAVENEQWDLLDRLLEVDRTHMNDPSYFTDTWGEWWGLLMECIRRDREDGVRILLKHGADRNMGNLGDCIPESPLEAAAEKKEILALLKNEKASEYRRKTDPPLPEPNAGDQRVNGQGQIAEETGLLFQMEGLE